MDVSNPSFAGRHVFVAGGSSGINFGIAQAFARAGAKLSVISRSADKVASAAAALQALGAEAQGQSADVRQPEAVQAALDAAAARFGAIDVLVSGAAGNFLAQALDMSPNAFKTVVDIDLLGSFNVARLAHAHLRKPGACVIQISASQAFTPTPFQAHVCAAKAGVDMLTRVLALEWGHEGIRVNSIVPGPIADTEGLKRLAPRRRRAHHARTAARAAEQPRRRARRRGDDAARLRDGACGAVEGRLRAREVVTIDMHIAFMRPAAGKLTAVGRVTGGGRSVCFCEAHILDAEGERSAHAMGTFRYRDPA